MSSPLLQLKGITKRYAIAGASEPLNVLDELDLQMNAPDDVAIIGPSGSGKSTLLNIIGTLDQQDEGTVELVGRTLSTMDDKQLAEVRNRDMGFIFQFHYLLPQCSVWENVLVPTLAAAAGEQKDVESRARRLLERVGLGQRLNHRSGQLSGGERQRVAVVRALINRPKLLLADEPTGALDRHNAEGLMNLLLELNREENVAMIVVTHARELAEKLSRVVELRDGKLHDVKKETA